MRVENFTLAIRGTDGEIKPETDGYVVMRDGEMYSLALANLNELHAHLAIMVDGVSIGEFQIQPYYEADLERPLTSSKRFTFHAAGTAAKAGEVAVEKGDKGSVQVVFTPSRPAPTHDLSSFPVARGGSDDSHHATRSGSGPMDGRGVKGITGNSNQRFGKPQEMLVHTDESVTISLRLVIDKEAGEPNPLPGRAGNPVPPAVD